MQKLELSIFLRHMIVKSYLIKYLIAKAKKKKNKEAIWPQSVPSVPWGPWPLALPKPDENPENSEAPPTSCPKPCLH